MNPRKTFALAFAVAIAAVVPTLAPVASAEPSPTYSGPQHPAFGDADRYPSLSRLSNATSTTIGEIFVPVLLVEFPDRPANHAPSDIQRLLFRNDSSWGAGSFRDYYQDMSGGLLDVTGKVTDKWMEMSRPMNAYAGDDNGGQASEPNDRTLVAEAVRQADKTIDFCKADSDHDGIVDALFVVHAGPGAEETGNGLWSMRWWLPTPMETDDVCDGEPVKVSDFLMVPEEYRSDTFSAPNVPDHLVSIGVFVHEFGHFLGLPDLYDTDGSSPGGVGPWDVMATGTYGFDGRTPWRPTPMSAWTRSYLGWVRPKNVSKNLLSEVVGALGLGGSRSNAEVYRLAPGGDPDATEYFLIENRKAEGWGADFPTSGIAIWHIEANRYDNDTEGHRLVHLVQADGRNELGASGDIHENGDAGDLFPGSTNNHKWGPATDPASNLNSGKRSGLRVKIQGRPGDLVVDLLIGDGGLIDTVDDVAGGVLGGGGVGTGTSSSPPKKNEPGLHIDDVEASPESFSPNGDHRKDVTKIHWTIDDPANMTVTILNSRGVVIRHVLVGAARESGPGFVKWAGLDDDGRPVKKGLYMYEVTATGETGKTPTKTGFISVISYL